MATTTSGLSSQVSSDQFMQLFVTQLKYQNPLNPQDSSAFLSQLAQFTSLEQEQQQTQYLSSMSKVHTASLQVDQLSMASTFIGKTIKYYSDGSGKSSETSTGVVEGVKLEKDGTVSFIVGGKSVSLSNFLEVGGESTKTTSSGVLSTLFGVK